MAFQADLLSADSRGDATVLPLLVRKDGLARDSVESSRWQGRVVLVRQYLIGWRHGKVGDIAISPGVTDFVHRHALLELAQACPRHGVLWPGRALEHRHDGPVGRIVSLVVVGGTPTEVRLRVELVSAK